MSRPLALIILAAGKGSRMQSDLPKVMHHVAQAPLLAHALASTAALEPARRVIITGHQAEVIEDYLAKHDPEAICARQEPQLGTGHAVAQARAALQGFDGDALVLYGDTPFIQPETLERIFAARADHDMIVLGFEADPTTRYGRLITNGDALDRIVEYKDATEAERAITLCNSGVICADAAVLMDLVDAVENNNAAEEYYLTDTIAIARARGLSAGVVRCDEAETLGINTRAELARAETLFQSRARAAALEDGVLIQAPDTVIFAQDTVLGRDAVIDPYVVFAPGVTVESGAHIRAFSHLEGCHVARDAVVGPYARLRPGAELAESVRIGNFVEVKNAQIDTGAKVNHLSYIGDATIGAHSNIGAGTITCNYDGVFKHKTTIGRDVFVGSNTMLVAPVTLGDEAMTGSGSVITSDVPAQALAIARARQEVKPGLAKRLFDKLRAQKAAKGK